MSGQERVLAQVLTRIDEYEEAWGWHDQTDELLAGYGHHMMQMLYRLPRDGQTEDMQQSIKQMLTDLRSLAAAAAPEAAIEIPAHHLVGTDLGFTCTNCGKHTSLVAPCIPARLVPLTPVAGREDAASSAGGA